MSGITSSVGLVSGIATADLIDQLMAIESQTVNTVTQRISETETTKTAWMSLSASVLGLKMSADSFASESTFKASTATSSNESVMTASASVGATPGTYQFTVKRLATNHQLISTGYSDLDSLVGAGTLSFDMGKGDINASTSLDFLNGQSGISRGYLKITDRAGTTSQVDLTDAMTVADVLDAINLDPDLGITARVSGDSIVLDDTTGLAGTISVGEVGLGTTAADLGLLGSATDASLVGGDINSLGLDTSLDQLNGGAGIERAAGVDDMVITLSNNAVLNISLLGSANDESDTAHTVGDVLDAINNAEGNDGKLVASLSADGNGITLTDTTGGSGDLVVADAAGSLAATHLGLAGAYSGGTAEGTDLISGLNSVLLRSLNGGAGMDAGVLDLQDRSGATASVDLSGADSLSEVIDAINNSGLGLVASINEGGTGLVVTDTTGATAANMKIADASGDVAATLGIAVDDSVDSIAGDNVNLAYVTSQTKLDDLQPGKSWSGGKLTITNSLGEEIDVDLTNESFTRLGDVVKHINSNASDSGVTARINDQGTGIILEDTNDGSRALSVSSESGSVAELLGIAGTAAEGETFIDGGGRNSLTIEETDTLDDLATKINEANMGISASIVNDGTSSNSYHLVLMSESTGSEGKIVFDTGATGLELTTFGEARDALVYLGAPGNANALALTSSSNTLSDFVEGVDFDLHGVDDNPVTVTVDRDDETIISNVETFISSFNSLISTIDDYTSFNPDTMAKGVLFADSNVTMMKSRLMNMVLGSVDVDGEFNDLSDVGISLSSGSQLTLDTTKFKEALDENASAVLALFATDPDTEEVTENGVTTDEDIEGTGGIGAVFGQILDSMSDDYDGFITRITDSLDTQIADMNDRVDTLNELLESKRARYEAQFAAMEVAISEMQSQTSSLSSLSTIASQMSVV